MWLLGRILFACLFLDLNIYVGQNSDYIGSKEFLYSFFSTVAVRLEHDKWGSRFPIMKQLSTGQLRFEKAQAGLEELSAIGKEFKEFEPKDLVWNMKDREARPPWDNLVNSPAGSLSNCFITSEGADLVKLLRSMLENAKKTRQNIFIE